MRSGLQHRYDGNFLFPGGRALRVSKRGTTHPARPADGKGTVLGAGGLEFRCIEPFRRWRVFFEDTVYESTVAEQIAGNFRVYAEQPIDPRLKQIPPAGSPPNWKWSRPAGCRTTAPTRSPR